MFSWQWQLLALIIAAPVQRQQSEAAHRQSSARSPPLRASPVTDPQRPKPMESVADRWKRVLWRLTEQQDELWKGLMKAATRPRKRGSKKGRPVPPTLKQLACRHPEDCRWRGANQWARYEKCLRCGLRLVHVPIQTKVLPASAATTSTSASSGNESDKKKGAPRAKAPSMGYVREPPQSKVEEFMDRALQPIVKAHAMQQESLAQQQQMMNHLADSMRQQQTFLTGLLSHLPAAFNVTAGQPASSGHPVAGAPVPEASAQGATQDLPPRTVERFHLVDPPDSDGTISSEDAPMDMRHV